MLLFFVSFGVVFLSTDCPALLQTYRTAFLDMSWAFNFKGSPGESDVQPGLLTMGTSEFQKSYQKLSASLSRNLFFCVSSGSFHSG